MFSQQLSFKKPTKEALQMKTVTGPRIKKILSATAEEALETNALKKVIKYIKKLWYSKYSGIYFLLLMGLAFALLLFASAML
jgi:hypothetical protein